MGAKVGDIIEIIKTRHTLVMNGYEVGDIFEVSDVFTGSVGARVCTPCGRDYLRFWHDEYRVIEKAKGDDSMTYKKEVGCGCSCIDHNIALAGEMAQLRRNISHLRDSINGVKTDVEKVAETARNADYMADKSSEDVHALAYEVDKLKRKTSVDELAELGAEIIRVVERRQRRHAD